MNNQFGDIETSYQTNYFKSFPPINDDLVDLIDDVCLRKNSDVIEPLKIDHPTFQGLGTC